MIFNLYLQTHNWPHALTGLRSEISNVKVQSTDCYMYRLSQIFNRSQGALNSEMTPENDIINDNITRHITHSMSFNMNNCMAGRITGN